MAEKLSEKAKGEPSKVESSPDSIRTTRGRSRKSVPKRRKSEIGENPPTSPKRSVSPRKEPEETNFPKIISESPEKLNVNEDSSPEAEENKFANPPEKEASAIKIRRSERFQAENETSTEIILTSNPKSPTPLNTSKENPVVESSSKDKGKVDNSQEASEKEIQKHRTRRSERLQVESKTSPDSTEHKQATTEQLPPSEKLIQKQSVISESKAQPPKIEVVKSVSGPPLTRDKEDTEEKRETRSRPEKPPLSPRRTRRTTQESQLVEKSSEKPPEISSDNSPKKLRGRPPKRTRETSLSEDKNEAPISVKSANSDDQKTVMQKRVESPKLSKSPIVLSFSGDEKIQEKNTESKTVKMTPKTSRNFRKESTEENIEKHQGVKIVKMMPKSVRDSLVGSPKKAADSMDGPKTRKSTRLAFTDGSTADEDNSQGLKSISIYPSIERKFLINPVRILVAGGSVALSPGPGPNPGDLRDRDRDPVESRDNRPSLVLSVKLQFFR